jgi:hypothetical protein
MHKRLSLAMLLLSAPVCGIEENLGRKEPKVSAALRRKMIVRAFTLNTSVDTQPNTDQPDLQEQHGEQSRSGSASRSRSNSGSQAGCVSLSMLPSFTEIPNRRKGVPFPSEGGDVYGILNQASPLNSGDPNLLHY